MIVLGPLINVLYDLLWLYKLALFIYIIMGWLEMFNIVNRYNSIVYSLHNFLHGIIEPVLTPIRRFIPPIGGWDLSPIILIFSIYFLQMVLVEVLKTLSA